MNPNANDDLASRSYDLKGIGADDPRFLCCRSEALFVQTVTLVVSVVAILIGYALSPTTEELAADPQLVTLFGYPLWVMVPTLIFTVEVIVFIIFGLKVFKTPSLAARDGDSDKNK
jgi:hypothetical protein